jgi:glycine/D-amino acid oxidase-like deaminating enzyme
MHVQIPRVLSGRLRRASAGLGTSRRFASASSSDYDVVIAGGGIIGASVAYHLLLAEPTLKVCVIERDPTYTAASAVLSAGGVRQQFSLAANIRLSLYGVDFIRAASSMLAVPGQTPPDLQFREQGYLFLASEAGEPTLRRNVATQRSCGVDWTTLLSPSDLRARFPWINTDGLALGCFGARLAPPTFS